MMPSRPRLLAMLGCVFAALLPLGSFAQTPTPLAANPAPPAPTEISLASDDANGSAEPGHAAVVAIESPDPRRIRLPQDNTAISYRLEIFGDLFTPAERDELKVSANLLGSARAMLHAESASSLQNNARASGGSAYAGAISASLVFGSGTTAADWPALSEWAPPRGSIRGGLTRELVPMGWDLAERSRNGSANGGAAWIERAVAILPYPHGSQTWQAGAAGLRVGTLSLLSGSWPSLDRMTAADFSNFCKVWFKRSVNLALADVVGSLLTPKNLTGAALASAGPLSPAGTIRAERVRLERAHPAPPVTLYYTF